VQGITALSVMAVRFVLLTKLFNRLLIVIFVNVYYYEAQCSAVWAVLIWRCISLNENNTALLSASTQRRQQQQLAWKACVIANISIIGRCSRPHTARTLIRPTHSRSYSAPRRIHVALVG